MAPRSLSRSGCWTCRIRHKKCDEISPECLECESRTITCHGYGRRPHWMDDPALLSAEKQRIKRIVNHNFRQSKRVHRNRTTAPGDHPEARMDSHDLGATLQRKARIDHQDANECRALVFREAELTMYYLDCIFPILFPYWQWDNKDGGRGWLFWLLTQNEPLRQAALSLAALHQRSVSSSSATADQAELLEYHTSALSGLRKALCDTDEISLTADPDQMIHLLACGCSLVSFEVRYDESLISARDTDTSGCRYVKEDLTSGKLISKHSHPLLVESHPMMLHPFQTSTRIPADGRH